MNSINCMDMKHLNLTFLFCLVTLMANAQGLYKRALKYDKFDDIIWQKDVKTLITKNDSCFVVETKGQKPVEYYYLGDELTSHIGRRDSLANLAANVYGFQTDYVCMTRKQFEKTREYLSREFSSMPDSLYKLNAVGIFYNYLKANYEKYPRIVFRTISTSKYSFEYENDLAWIEFEDGSRLIYTNRK